MLESKIFAILDFYFKLETIYTLYVYTVTDEANVKILPEFLNFLLFGKKQRNVWVQKNKAYLWLLKQILKIVNKTDFKNAFMVEI